MTDNCNSDTQHTSEPVIVEWDGSLSGWQTVRVDPYTAKITVNGREFAIGQLCSDDIPDWMFRQVDTDN